MDADSPADFFDDDLRAKDENGMLEYATLELRVHPPSVKIDNTLEEGSTVVIVDSANRPGTLVGVVESRAWAPELQTVVLDAFDGLAGAPDATSWLEDSQWISHFSEQRSLFDQRLESHLP